MNDFRGTDGGKVPVALIGENDAVRPGSLQARSDSRRAAVGA
jgi:hypothetical protein